MALPAVTLPTGVLPSTLLMVTLWLYMVVSALLVAEANLQAIDSQAIDSQAAAAQSHKTLGLLGTISTHLGKPGAWIAGSVYLFFHYTLLVAYIARGGDILAEALSYFAAHGHGLAEWLAPLQSLWRPASSEMPGAIPLWWGHLLFACLLGGVLWVGSDRFVAWLNNLFVALVMGSFVGLLALTLARVDPSLWATQDWQAVTLAIPAMSVAFVYHNVVPVVVTQLGGDRPQIRQAILQGSLIPLVMFMVWNAVILGSLGSLPPAVVGEVLDPIEMLRMGKANPWLGTAVSAFSEFAIATSFIGFVLGLQNFYRDLFQLPKQDAVWQGPIYLLILLPPLALSVLSPSIFFQAIEVAGAFGISVLFGIIPAMMAWQYRYRTQPDPATAPVLLAGGGKPVLLLMIALAIGVIFQNALLATGLL